MEQNGPAAASFTRAYSELIELFNEDKFADARQGAHSLLEKDIPRYLRISTCSLMLKTLEREYADDYRFCAEYRLRHPER